MQLNNFLLLPDWWRIHLPWIRSSPFQINAIQTANHSHSFLICFIFCIVEFHIYGIHVTHLSKFTSILKIQIFVSGIYTTSYVLICFFTALQLLKKNIHLFLAIIFIFKTKIRMTVCKNFVGESITPTDKNYVDFIMLFQVRLIALLVFICILIRVFF